MYKPITPDINSNSNVTEVNRERDANTIDLMVSMENWIKLKRAVSEATCFLSVITFITHGIHLCLCSYLYYYDYFLFFSAQFSDTKWMKDSKFLLNARAIRWCACLFAILYYFLSIPNGLSIQFDCPFGTILYTHYILLLVFSLLSIYSTYFFAKMHE